MLQPDRDSADYVRFYDEIGAAQLEERYMARHSYALARFHLVRDCLLAETGAQGRLLDIGCASGYYTVAFARAGGRARGIDISTASVALARRRAEQEGVADRCDFVVADMRKLPVRDGEYDAVLMVEVLEHVREQEAAVASAVRALRPGGVLVLTTPHAFDKLTPLKRLRYRNAPRPEDAGVTVKQLDTNPFVAEAGIGHEPYFHDAFTFEQLRRLLPPEAQIVRLHCLYMLVPGVRLMSHAPDWVRRLVKLALRPRGAAEAPQGPPPQRATAADAPMPVPPLDIDAALMVKLSKLMWRIPVLRMVAYHHLLVARRRPVEAA